MLFRPLFLRHVLSFPEYGVVSLLVVEDAEGLFHLFVELQGVLHHTALEIVASDDVGIESLHDDVFVEIKLVVEVVAELRLKRVELFACLVIVAFELRYLHEVFEVSLALAVVFEPGIDDVAFEIVVVAVGEGECACGGDGGMAADVIDDVAHHDIGRV